MLKRALRKNTIENKLVPLFVGSSIKRIGVQPVMDAVIGRSVFLNFH